jgi:glycolate oxidase FAD binding subunit
VDLNRFADEIGATGPVSCVGARQQWDVGGVIDPQAREVTAPAGIQAIAPEEMTAACGAGTSVEELIGALAQRGQTVALPPWGTVGGVLAVGRSGVDRLGHGPVRDTLLQARVVTAEGRIVKAGGATVKNVSGFDLCRLFVGSLGTLAFLGDVILRTRPRPQLSQWYEADLATSPFGLFRALYRPVSMLWDGERTWVLLEGDARDVVDQAGQHGLTEVEGPPALPPERHSVEPSALREWRGTFVAEVGVGILHVSEAPPPRQAAEPVVALHRRLKERFDPTGRLNPGRDPLLA